MSIIKTISLKKEHDDWVFKNKGKINLSKICQKAIEKEMLKLKKMEEKNER